MSCACARSIRRDAGEHFHPNRVTDRDLAFEQGFDTIAGRGPGVTKKFDPCGRINQNHVKRLVRNSPRSPSQPEPRRCRFSEGRVLCCNACCDDQPF